MLNRIFSLNPKLYRNGLLAAVVAGFVVPILGFAQPADESALNLFIDGQADAAVRTLRSSLNANPSDAQQHNLLCRVQYAEERWDAAVSECERAANLDPKNGTYQLWLG